MVNFFETLVDILSVDKRFFSEEGILLRNKIYESALSMDAGLLEILIKNTETRKRFFTDVNGTLVFDKVGFGWIVNNREFLPDSYTRFKNHVGLADDHSNLISVSNDVVLSFPYKDCILEGGQTKEDQKRDETYYNATLAPNEVDRLLYPKVLVGANRYTASGIEEGVIFGDSDNLIIKGNNLLAIASLLKRYEGKVRCIYIDPPYNTGGDGFNYNDKFNHVTWLVFMKNRLEVARRLLSNNGSIWITLDNVESHYLKVLCDEIFTRECFVTEVEWRHSDNSNNNALTFSIDTNHILVYSKKPGWKPNFLNDSEKRKHFSNPDNNMRGAWFDGNPVNNPGLRSNLQFNIVAPNGNIIKHPPNGWRWSKETMDEKFATGELRFSEDQTRVIRRTYLNEMEGLPPSTLWTNFDVTGHTRKAKYELKSLFPDVPVTSLFATPKPELLLNYIFDLATDAGDLVLDFFLGSGTTCAVAHKKKLLYVGIEQMDYISTFAVPRLSKVIAGEQGGVSVNNNWHGGGSFVYCELAKCNQQYVDEVTAAKTDTDLMGLLDHVVKSGFISSRVNPGCIKDGASDFKALLFEEKKRFILEMLDKNMLYVNLCDLDDEDYVISDADKAFTRSFYGSEDM